MRERKKAQLITALTVLGCGVMLLVDGVLRPPYAVKSAIKLTVFCGCMLVYALADRTWQPLHLLKSGRKQLALAATLGVAVFAVILAGYFLLQGVFDFGSIVGALEQNAGVTRDNFVFVSCYIAVVNSLLEELFFRGFAFSALARQASLPAAYAVSSLCFALYHTAMMLGWFSPALFLLALAGLAVGGGVFAWLNQRTGNILPSWAVHMCANLAINLIGFRLMGLV